MPKTLSIEYINEAVKYDPETGLFFWKERPLGHFSSEQSFKRWKTVYSGKIAGSLDSDGYIVIRINYEIYFSHRLAWILMTGKWPKSGLDHIDGNPINNKISNLREVNQSQNNCNAKIRRDNSSGLRGVTWDKERNKWQVQLSINKKRVFYARYDSLEDAKISYKKASEKYHGEFARAA